jgi:GDPmannose 4,6-dehydratase
MLMTRYYREKRGIFASVGILYNHESPLRSPRFVTRKIASAAARIATEGSGELVLGDIEARVDWGYARDYVNAIHLVLQTDRPGDYVIASGEAHTVGEFADIAFRHVGLDYRNHLVLRPQTLSRKNLTRIGDSSRLRFQTGWRPTVSFAELVCLMVDAELKQCGAKDALDE